MALNSKTTLKIIDALCEGPIEGLAEVRGGGRKSVFLNETIVTGRQFNTPTVKILTKQGTGTQGPFNEGSTFNDQQTTIEEVNQEVGSSYSEDLKTDGSNTVKKRNYGAGQVTRAIAKTDIDLSLIHI